MDIRWAVTCGYGFCHTGRNKGYIINLAACSDRTPVTAEFVTGLLPPALPDRKIIPYARSDLEAQPHLPLVFADLAISRWIEH